MGAPDPKALQIYRGDRGDNQPSARHDPLTVVDVLESCKERSLTVRPDLASAMSWEQR
jgi:hypothetical protein